MSDVVDIVNRFRDELAQTASKRIRARVCAYAEVDGDDIAEVSAAMIAQVCADARDDRPAPLDREVLREAAARRVKSGVQLADWLAAVRITETTVAGAVSRIAASRATSITAAVEAVEAVRRHSDGLYPLAVSIFEDAQRADEVSLCEQLIRDLLTPRSISEPAELARCALAGLGGDDPCVVALLRTPDDPEVLRQVVDRVRQPPVAALVAEDHGELVVIGSAKAVAPALTLPVGHHQLQAGMSSPQQSLAEIPLGFREAQIALSRATPTRPLLAISDLTPGEYLSHCQAADPVARAVVPERLTAFILNEPLAADLLDTLQAYADADLNARLCAEQLGVHVNTVRQRLERIRTETGIEVRHLRGLLDVLAARQIIDARRG